MLGFFKAMKVFLIWRTWRKECGKQERENSWPDPDLPDKNEVTAAIVLYKKFFCTEEAKSYLMTSRRKKKNQTVNIPDLPTPARPKIASFTSALLAMLEGMEWQQIHSIIKSEAEELFPAPVFGFTMSL